MKRISWILVASVALMGCPGGDDDEDEIGSSTAPLCPEPEAIPSNITSTVEVGVECRNVVASGGVTIGNGGKLKVAPGTTVTFFGGTGIRVNGGIIEAVGTPNARILFKGQEDVPGYWQGISLYGALSTQNRLAHVIIESAGSSSAVYTNVAGALTVQNNSRLEVTDTVLRRNAGYGIVLQNAEVTTFTNNELSENELGPAHTTIDSVGQLHPENNYAGNTVNAVRLTGGTLSTPVILHDLGVPFISPSITVQANGRLKIEPGVEVRFEAGAHIELRGGILEARGTADRPILLAGAETTAGFWKGVGLLGAPSTENILDHVTITDAGSAAFVYASHPCSIYLSEPSDRIVIRNTTVDRGKGFGLLVRSEAQLTEFHNNVLTGHELGAASMFAATANGLDQQSTYTGNAVNKDFVLIRGNPVRVASTWKALDAPYRVEGDVSVRAGGHLTIEGGTRVEFGANASLEATETTAQLNILGTSGSRVQLTRTSDTAFWRGVRFYNTSSHNRIEHTDISYGGSTPFIYFSNGQGANLAVDNSRVELEGVHLSQGNNFGLAVRASHEIIGCDAVSYTGNASGPVSGTPNCT